MENQTVAYVLVLTGLSDLLNLQLPLFLLFLLVYIMTIVGNLLILLLIFTDSHLHTPMKKDNPKACLTQIYFFVYFGVSEVFLLGIMSYDRYIAICRPLYYMQIMSWNVCVKLTSGVLISTAVYSLVHTSLLSKLTFCDSNPLQSLFCDLPQLLEVSCSDTFINVLLIFLFGIFLGVGILAITFFPYITIKIPSKNMRSKAFSTCSSHLTVVFIFYTTIIFNYFRPNAKSHFTEDKVASVFYAILTPFLNPLIYSLRNQEIKTSLKKTLQLLQITGKIG
ncbi:hypothetical protein XELAEV_18047919mg [Xenopus laevis]|uniref:Olfactory receptor n=1 Tax=Xenopus laevis TaxID=8355 RepID=A0A974BVR6_XENLA|nr:hypothetical protein XELAEV_18047919mg [Xenopus laevis]